LPHYVRDTRGRGDERRMIRKDLIRKGLENVARARLTEGFWEKCGSTHRNPANRFRSP